MSCFPPIRFLKHPLWAVTAAVWASCAVSSALELHVSTGGDDASDGSATAPLRSFEGARAVAQRFAGRENVTIHFAKGIYYLPETVRFGTADSGTAAHPVVYAGEEGAVLSGGTLLTPEWKPDGNGHYTADTPPDLEIDQLWINGRREPMARFPNREEGKSVFGFWNLEHRNDPDPENNPLAPERVARWADPAGAYLHAMHISLWGDMHWRVNGKLPDGSLDLEGGWQNNRPSKRHPRYQMIENVFEELDAPGEWFHDRRKNRIFYQPRPGTNLASARVEVVRLPRLLSFEGTAEAPVKFIGVRGFTFRHAARTFMRNKEPLLRSDWTVCRDGAVFFQGTEDCSIGGCGFDQVGGNTVFASGYNRRITVRSCHIHDSGASGIAFVGNPDAVRSPLFRYGPQDYGAIDRTPGPKSQDFPADCLVEDCLIARTGRDEKQSAGVEIDMAARITVRDCTIHDVPRAGINIGDGCWGGHLIEGCDVFATVLETSDHGSFNSWGRDRYWDPSIAIVNREVAKDPALPSLDAIEPVVLRHNRWRCDHGWDIDLDDGSSNFLIEDNLLLNGGLKLREGFKRIARNNVIVNNSLHPHCWYEASGDVFSHNLVFKAYQPAGGMPSGKWGDTMDRNWFVGGEADRARFAGNRCDAGSASGDIAFIDAAKGDFRVGEDSPVLAIGFRNFAMDRFGVRSPELRALAGQPEIPAIRAVGGSAAPAKPEFVWLGAGLMDLSGEEFSAYGIAREGGGIAVRRMVGEDAVAARGGLKAGDLIQTVNGRAAGDLIALREILRSQPEDGGWKLGIIRDQRPAEIRLVEKAP